MMIKEQYISLDTARMLKDASFNVPCRRHYTKSGSTWETAVPETIDDSKSCTWFPCPTQALAARWLREVHHINVYACFDYERFDERKWFFTREHTLVNDDSAVYCSITNYNSYEEALESGLKHGLELVKK